VQELWGFAARGDFDLTQHQKFSGKSMEYFDETAKKRYVPHVVEPSVGVDRIFLAALCAGYAEDEAPDDKGKLEKRTVLRLSPRLAPVKVAVLPLVKNKPELVAVADQLHARLKRKYVVFYDQSGAIGRRYRRQDEIGTPWCVTIDFDTLANGTFTLRERDSMKQERIDEKTLFTLLDEKLV
jgi:glycyl-tRNA synthetase